MSRYPGLPNPLNPTLHEMLVAECNGDVRIVNPGSPLQYRIQKAPGKRPVVKSWGGSEEYVVNCPLCNDKRHRCHINHAMGTRVEGVKVRYLAHCFNEDCRGLYEWVMARLEAFREWEQETAPPHGIAPVAVGPGPLDIHAVAREAAEKHERLEGVLPLERLPAGHGALEYVRGRGLDPLFLSREFGVGCGSSGAKARRLVIPVFFDGIEVGWTARAVPGMTDMRVCRSESPWPYDVPKYVNAFGFPKSKFLYNFDRAREHRVIAVAEGVSDVWKIGVWGMALFGKHMSAAQCDLLCSAAEAKEAWIVLLGDASTERDDAASAWRQNFQAIRAKYKYPSRLRLQLFDDGDPGDRTSRELHSIVDGALRSTPQRSGYNASPPGSCASPGSGNPRRQICDGDTA